MPILLSLYTCIRQFGRKQGESMEEKPIGALGVVKVLVLTILIFWFGVYATLFARG